MTDTPGSLPSAPSTLCLPALAALNADLRRVFIPPPTAAWASAVNGSPPVPSRHVIAHVTSFTRSNNRKEAAVLWPSHLTNQILPVLAFFIFEGYEEL